ncbi:helix-turn-helix transcriptional regulator [Streptomyces sp. 891-h]|uniref:helix-turn-helix domain-containing protein n=1 Tax=Streptomyces sp. 891-h TaxID=2720714 RepID=UPI001FAA1F2D|nr:helix-turn-helix transcriptional regulator [Streptomyces sp. 891-h]UNZ21333.1 helix-turn-helix transcriptional regulator [Streptomyces sp. 891-h]
MDVPISITPADLGRVVRAARAAAGLTQVELGHRCGYSHSVISRIENGHVTPVWPTVTRLAACWASPLSGWAWSVRAHLAERVPLATLWPLGFRHIPQPWMGRMQCAAAECCR